MKQKHKEEKLCLNKITTFINFLGKSFSNTLTNPLGGENL